MKRFYILSLMLCVHLLIVKAQNFTGNLTFSANMDGAQETPPVTTQATGIAGFTLNATHDTLCFNVSVIGLSGPITASHFHMGAPGVAGPVWINISAYINGNRIIGTLVSPPDSMLEKLMSGLLYINVHTAANPAGEIRGQIYLETDIPMGAILDGTQEVPSVPTPGYGFASFRLSKSLDRLTIHAVFSGLSGPITAIHLHNGPIGVSGPVVQDLMSGLTANTLTIDVDPTPYMSDLMAGNIYINAHTATNPTGEIRGQVTLNQKLAFYFIMSGANETPPNTAPGIAIGNVWLSNTMDTLFYYIAADTLTTVPTAAHLHLAAPGTAGPVIVPLTASGNILLGIVTDSTITLNLVRQMLEGMVYANIHTTTFPAGELRGQLRRHAREGFSFELNGNNEVPPVVTNATGFGLASLDGESQSLYYSFVVSDLNSAITAGHFHHAAAGQSGPVVFPLTTLTNNFGGAQAKGFWTSADTITPFTSVEAAWLFADSIYVNVHTNTSLSGEVRGQLTTGGLCYNIPIFINEINSDQLTVNAYPNPVIEMLHLDVSALNPDKATIVIHDVTGRLLMSKSIYLKAGVNNYEMDVSGFESGAYFIRLVVNDLEVFGKFIKE